MTILTYLSSLIVMTILTYLISLIASLVSGGGVDHPNIFKLPHS